MAVGATELPLIESLDIQARADNPRRGAGMCHIQKPHFIFMPDFLSVL
jgi:hypothetical protein